MLIRRIKCPVCKEEINSFYIIGGICPVCKSAFNSTRQKVSNTGLCELKKDRAKHKKDTMTKGQIKKMFKLSENQISEIPSTSRFSETRYYKTEVVKFVNNLK